MEGAHRLGVWKAQIEVECLDGEERDAETLKGPPSLFLWALQTLDSRLTWLFL